MITHFYVSSIFLIKKYKILENILEKILFLFLNITENIINLLNFEDNKFIKNND